jgi:hypothetical protein
VQSPLESDRIVVPKSSRTSRKPVLLTHTVGSGELHLDLGLTVLVGDAVNPRGLNLSLGALRMRREIIQS